MKADESKDKKKPKQVSNFHIDNPSYLNKQAAKTIERINKLIDAFRINKGNGKTLDNVSLEPKDFKSISSSVNAYLSKNKEQKITTSRFIYKGISITPTVEV